MVLYNITTKVDRQISTEWVNWMQHVYLPHVMECGIFEDYRLCRMKGVDESDGITYALQLMASSKPAFDIYQEKYAYDHQQLHAKEWKGRYVVFRSVLDVIAAG